MKVATLNANSIRARLELVLDWLGREAPDVLCLQETKVQDKDFPAAAFREAGYHVVFRGQKAYADVVTVSQEEPQKVALGFDDGRKPDEPRLIQAVIGGIPVVNTYVPPGRSPDSPHFLYKLEWLPRLYDLEMEQEAFLMGLPKSSVWRIEGAIKLLIGISAAMILIIVSLS